MSVIASVRGDSRQKNPFLSQHIFDSPQPAGRKITAGFTYLQRIGKGATYDVWFPDALRRELDARSAAGLALGSEQFPAEWAAVRQFELLQESGNHKIYDLDPVMLQRSMLDLSRSMRAGGYRVTVATLGCYQDRQAGDELEILDRSLQERIEQMIHMLYLDEASRQANAEADAKLAVQKWDYREALPHVGIVLGAQELFDQKEGEGGKKGKGDKKGGAGGAGMPVARKNKQAREFFKILGLLPQKHIIHDTAIGLQLPELNGRNQWNYIAAPDETLAAFNRVLDDLFDKFNGISLSRLQGRADATDEIKASTLHLRGYGDHLSQNGIKLYYGTELALN
ncbi:MAG: hypothetical protein P4M13_06000 [Alphaproteobacteria bacterium]|nr:hypothetical protein [Alphaproteobacteria bacterium]